MNGTTEDFTYYLEKVISERQLQDAADWDFRLGRLKVTVVRVELKNVGGGWSQRSLRIYENFRRTF